MVIWFDFDATIVSVETRFWMAYRQACVEAGVMSLDQPYYWQMRCEGHSSREILALTEGQWAFEQFARRRSKLIEDPALLARDQLRPGVQATLAGLADCGFILRLLSGRQDRTNLLIQIQELGLEHFFTAVMTVSPFGGWQEKAAILLRYGQRGQVMVGDTAADILAGKAAGMKTVAVLGGMCTRERLLTAGPDALIPDLPALLNEMRWFNAST